LNNLKILFSKSQIMVRKPNSLPLLALAVAVSIASAGSVTSAADDRVNEAFGAAVEAAQRRCVKIFGAGIGRSEGYGTGLIVSPDGLILSAQGVYLAGERIRVALPDGSLQMATVQRRSQRLQAALLKVDAKTPDYFDLSQKVEARKGDWALAVSNAFKVADGPEPLSVNLGVVSLRTKLDAQNGVQDVPYEGDVLLIDAITSNPGAPGGAVVTVDGQLLGMIGRLMESKATSTRLNYAVPADLLADFVADKEPMAVPTVNSTTTTTRSETGIRLFALGGKRDPAYIDRVLPNSPAAAAGLKPDDLVVSMGGEVIRDVSDFKAAIKQLPPGVEVEIVVKRKDDVLTLKLSPAPAN
jgi:serine protease Do